MRIRRRSIGFGSRPGVHTRPLREEKDERDDRNGDDRRRHRPAERQPAMPDRLIEKIADGGAERPRQDERRPEQPDTRRIGPEIGGGKDRERRRENQAPA